MTDLFSPDIEPPRKPKTKRVATKKKKAPKSGARNSMKTGACLEMCIEQLAQQDFGIYRNRVAFVADIHPPARYVIRHYRHKSLYGTPGRKEALIHDECGDEYIIEAKFQQKSGSVDEKLPYVLECFRHSAVKYWILVYDGAFWEDGRGEAAIAWLKAQPLIIGERRLLVMSRAEFSKFVRNTWGPKKGA